MEKALCTTIKPMSNVHGVTFFDSTLREGEAAPGVSFTKKEKLEIVHRLAKVGVEGIQIAYMGLKPHLKELTQEICQIEKQMGKVVANHGWDEHIFEMIDYAADTDVDTLNAAFFASPFGPQPVLNDADKEATKRQIEKVVQKILSTGKSASIGFIDSTRTKVDDLLEYAQVACKSGVKKISLSDTVGCATPEGISEIVSRVCEVTEPYNVRVGIHCHNDFGLCLANTLAGIQAGARIACTTIDGLGERCGNASMVEVAATLEVLYGVKTGLDLSAMTELSRYVEEITKLPLPGSKPFVGRYAFAHKQNSHMGYLLHNPLSAQAVDASIFGNEAKVLFGKPSGPFTYEYMSKKRGIEVPEKYYSKITDKLAELDDGTKGRIISEEQFWAVVKAVQSKS